MRFRAEQHLRRQLDFAHVRTHGRRHDCGAFMLWYARQAAPPAPAVAAVPTVTGSVSDPTPALPVASSPVPPKKKADTARVGVVASRSAIGNAIQRARAKRRLREVFRHHQQRVPAGFDVLLVARSSINRLEYQEIERRFSDACLKIFRSAQA